MIIPNFKADSYALLTRSPCLFRGIRLACVRYTASVRSEPGSNSHNLQIIIKSEYSKVLILTN